MMGKEISLSKKLIVPYQFSLIIPENCDKENFRCRLLESLRLFSVPAQKNNVINFYENSPCRSKYLESRNSIGKIGQKYYYRVDNCYCYSKNFREKIDVAVWDYISPNVWNREVIASAIHLVERGCNNEVSLSDKLLIGKIARESMWKTLEFLNENDGQFFRPQSAKNVSRNELIVNGLREYGFDVSASCFSK